MKILLLSINAKFAHSSLAVWFLAAGIEKYSTVNHNVKIIEATINQTTDTIVEQITSQNPDLIGISTYIWNVGIVSELLPHIRERLPNVIIVSGGPEASHNAEYWLENGSDYVVCGEGERRFAVLADLLENQSSIGNDWRADPVPATVNPYSDEYFKRLGGRIAYIETSRGCPFSCTYCLSGSVPSNERVRFFDTALVKEQIRKLSESGTRTIKFVDRTFNCNQKRAYEIFEYIIALPQDLNSDCCFHFEIAADLLDEPLLVLLKKVPRGKIQFEIGIQSFHKPTLEAVSRKSDLEKAVDNIKTLLLAENIHIHIDLIAGLPFETLEIFKDSFDSAYSLKPHMLQLGFLKLLHGSKLREQVAEYGMSHDNKPPYQIISNKWLSPEDLEVIETAEDALQHTYNKGRFLSALDYVLEVSGIRSFTFFQGLGGFVCANSIPLKEYTEKFFCYCAGLPNVVQAILRDCVVCDSLAMTKGKSIPDSLKSHGESRRQSVKAASERLGRTIDYDEAEVLLNGEFVYVDVENRDSVTKLYKVQMFS